ncbi:tetratricopeptide repeat protein [Chloroflexi bacterium TSY]|nr:tetratricopeptide repeat protein [Chloroflexi bacterium TSY]
MGVSACSFVEEVQERAMEMEELNPDEQPGLVATFAISYEALEDDERRFFRYTSVYSPALLNTRHMAALMEVEATATQKVLEKLARAALLARNPEKSGQYILHPLLRQYAYGLLQQNEDVLAIHKQAAEYLNATLAIDGVSPIEALEEVDQWEKAKEWSTLVHRASFLVSTLALRGYWSEIDQRLKNAQASIQEVGEVEELVAILWSNRGIIADKQGRWDKAISYYKLYFLVKEKR